MIFLRPLIMRDVQDGLTITNSKYNYIRRLQQGMQEEGVYLLTDESPPLMPEFDSQLELPPSYKETLQRNQQLFDDSDLQEMETP
jgi:general secretion pathway protein D